MMMSDTQPKVGDVVYMFVGKYGNFNSMQGVVTRISPTGQITADFGEKFAGNGKQRLRRFKSGREIGGDRWHPALLHDKEAHDRVAVKYGLRVSLDKAREFMRNASFTTRAELIQAIEGLSAIAAQIPGNDA